MRRTRWESTLHDYLTDECDDATRAEVEDLLSKDAKARALYDEMRAAHEALLLLRDRPAPEAPLDDIRRAIATGVFAGKPEPVMTAWGAQFYKRVAAAAVLTCGVSLGFLAHHTWSEPAGSGPPTVSTITPTAPAAPEPEMIRRGGPISAYDLMRKNNGNLVTFTPTDAVMPALDSEPR